jgi:hypothetical protein
VHAVQPTYQIPGELLKAHVERLRKCKNVGGFPPRLHALLFLSGLRAAFCYYRSAANGDEFFTNFAPTHHLDDGLSTAAGRCLVWLIERARSRGTREALRTIGRESAPGAKWAALSLSFAAFPTKSPRTVREWLACGETEPNLLRLSCAMGIEALWHSKATAFVQSMMSEPLSLAADELAAVKAFELTRATALPEL